MNELIEITDVRPLIAGVRLWFSDGSIKDVDLGPCSNEAVSLRRSRSILRPLGRR